MKKKLLLTVSVICCMTLALCGCGSEEVPEADRTAGCYNGNFVGQVDEDTDVLAFKGIPYAKSPTDDLRWKAPQAPDESDKTIEAKEFGKTSVQYSWHSEPAGENEAGVGEDCLTLNVWTKDLKSKDKPVMVWIHGGGFAWGGTADSLYNGATIVEEHNDVIVVSLNYRLGMLGEIDLSKVEGGEAFPDSKNLSMLDLMQGLTWVQENIQSFGGDPDNVTIFGNSAGGAFTSLLTASSDAQGLFKRAIAESGSLNLTYNQEDFDNWGTTEALMELTGAKNMDDLMAIPEKKMIKLYTEEVIDDEGSTLNDLYNMPFRGQEGVVEEDPYQALLDGVGKDVDLMVGSNADEWRYWINEMGDVEMSEMDEDGVKENKAMYKEYVAKAKKDEAYEVATEEEKAKLDEFYSLKQVKSLAKVWQNTELGNETGFRIPAIETASCHADAGGNTYMYYFDISSDNFDFIGACHASEVAYVFHNQDETIFSGTVDVDMADQICEAWVNFAKTGNPSVGDVEWSKYDTTDRNTMMITKDGLNMEKDPLGDQRALLQSFAKHYLK
ncbi:MAG: carboxylesterase family protein [Clostridiales bacterium]|nr:carboxylesterase family protein [Clostridiales bacterium]